MLHVSIIGACPPSGTTHWCGRPIPDHAKSMASGHHPGPLRVQSRADNGSARVLLSAWMLCAEIGILAAVIIWQILALAGIHEYVVVPLLTYTGFAVSAALLVWLFWFGH